MISLNFFKFRMRITKIHKIIPTDHHHFLLYSSASSSPSLLWRRITRNSGFSKMKRHPSQDEEAPIKQAAEQTEISPKNEWPELVGLDAAEAEQRIKEDSPGICIQVVPPDHLVTMDLDMGRVRLYIDSSEKIVKPPRIG